MRIATCALVVAALGFGAATSAGAAPAKVKRTTVSYVSPVNQTGTLIGGYTLAGTVKGSCQPGSVLASGSTVFRCVGAGATYVPCWAVTATAGLSHAAACLLQPWATSVEEVQTTTALTPAGGAIDFDSPWGVELASGQRCVAVQGATVSANGFTIDYSCPGTNFYLLRGISRSHQPFTIRTVHLVGSQYVQGPSAKLRVVWYARPA